MTRTQWWCAAAVGALAVVATAVLLTSSTPAREDTVRAVASSLSCPNCAGQSVAESDSPVAAGMRETIAEQLAAGQSPEQVRDWFVARYGPEVVRDPGTTVVLWLVPALAATALGAAAYAGHRRRRIPTDDEPSPLPRRRAFLAGSGVVVATIVGVAAGSWWIDRAHRDDATAVATQQADMSSAAAPDPSARLRTAFTLLRSGEPKAALHIASAVQSAYPDDPDALLILGLAQRATATVGGDRTLGRFLAAAPDHPAAPEVRRLLGREPTPSGGTTGAR